MKIRLFLVLVSALSAGIAHADIFRYVDADGTVHFTNVPNDSRYKVYLKEKRKPDPVTDTLASEIRYYDPKSNEISGEAQQGGEGRWLYGWVDVDKLVAGK
jgi:hypothetical protein